MLRYWIFRSSVSCSTSHACPCTGLAKNVNRQRKFFCAREISRLRQQICVSLCKKIGVNNDHTAHRSMIKRLDIIEPHVILLCVPRFGWVILRKDCLAHRAPTMSKINRTVPRVELQVERKLVCTRTIRSRSDVRTKISSLAPLPCFCEEQLQYRRSER